MLIKAFRILSLPIIMLSFIVCSKLDPYTTSGAGIINTIDPALTDFNGNFFAFSTDQSIVQDSFSTPTADQFTLKKVDDTLAAGFTDTISRIIRIVKGEKDTIRDTLTGLTKMSSTAGADTSYDTLRQVVQAVGNVKFGASVQQLKNYQPTDVVTAVTIVFNDTILDSIHFGKTYRDPGNKLKLYASTREFQANPFAQRISGATLLGSPFALADTSDTSLDYKIALDSIFMETVQKACSSFTNCRGDTNKTDSSITATCALPDTFYFSLFNNDIGALLRFKGARMIIAHKRDTSAKDTTIYLSTINGKISTVYSKQPRRTTVFKLNLAPLWESMSKNNFSEILSAALVIPGKIAYTESDTDSVALLQYYLTDVSYGADTALDARIDAATDLYHSGMNISRAGDSLLLPVDFFLQKISAGKPPSAYLYLQTFSKYGNWQATSFNKPRLRAVFTTIR